MTSLPSSGGRGLDAAAVLSHDIGKPSCHDPATGRFHGHDVAGAEMVPSFLDRIDPEGRIDRERVAWCVRHHLFWLHADLDLVRDARVARRYLRPDGWGDDLRVVNYCDGLGSLGASGSANVAYIEACQRKVEEVRARQEEAAAKPRPALDGNEVMEVLGLPPGPEVGMWLRRLAAEAPSEPDRARRWLLTHGNRASTPPAQGV